MIAHDFFGASPDGETVDFYVVKAVGKLEFPKIAWSIDDFEREFSLIDEKTSQLERLETQFEQADAMKALATSLLEQSKTEPRSLGPLGGLFRPPLEPHDCPPDPAIPETDGETPQDQT